MLVKGATEDRWVYTVYGGDKDHKRVVRINVAGQYLPGYGYSMMTSSNGNIFRVTGPLCGEFTGPGEFPTQRPVTRSFDVFFDRRLNKRLSKQPRGWWLEMLSCSLWRQSNASGFCRATDGLNAILPHDPYPCEALRVKDGCTAAYVAYSAGEAVPPGAVVGGNRDDGRAMYVASFHNVWGTRNVLSGYYLEGATHGWFSLLNNTAAWKKDMQLLVVL